MDEGKCLVRIDGNCTHTIPLVTKPFFPFHVRQYDFQSVLTASSLVYGFAAFAPLVIWFVFKQYDATLKFVSVVCLYGYSLTIFIPTVVRKCDVLTCAF